MVANILRLLFSDDPINRETGALVASGSGLVQPLYRQLHDNLEELRRVVFRMMNESRAEIVEHDNYLDKLNNIISNYRNAILELSCFMPRTYQSRQRQISTMVKNTTFQYMSMQCRQTPKTTAILEHYLRSYDLCLEFLYI